MSTRELAVKYTDENRYFSAESLAYRILKAADLITVPGYVVIKAADEFTDKTIAINEIWQAEFTYFKIIGHARGLPLARRLVLSQHHLGRFQPLHHRLEALHQHAGRGRDRYD